MRFHQYEISNLVLTSYYALSFGSYWVLFQHKIFSFDKMQIMYINKEYYDE